MHISPLRKNIPLTVVTLAALGIMLFLFFMHPSTPEESLEFYTPDGNGVGPSGWKSRTCRPTPPIRK